MTQRPLNKDPYCYYNGKIARLHALHLPLNDLGVLRAYGIFDYMRTHKGKLFFVEAHLDRFVRSARLIDLKIPVSRTELKRIALALIKKNGFPETGIKYVLTGGPSDDGITRTSAPSFFVIATPAHYPPEEYYVKGVALETHEYNRLLPEIKSLNYIISVRRQKELKRKGVLELLYVHKGNVLECSSSNIFIVKNARLITPKKDILEGTTKRYIIKLARNKYPVIERAVRVEELKTADEVFITAANKAIMPVVKIDNFKIADGKVGPVSRKLKRLYDQNVRGSV
jgi:branched-chain amino acid aminotransferase